MICEDCGKEGAAETTCPYAEEIYNETVECVLCQDCEHERAMDI